LDFILGSSSPRRLDLLNSIGIIPKEVISPNINESILKKELPLVYCKRIALEKLNTLINDYPNEIILTADTIAFCGRRILDKTKNSIEAKNNLKILSGKRHKVATSLCILRKDKKIITKTVISSVSMKSFSEKEIDTYIESNEWINVAGSYRIQGQAESFIKSINGSYSNIVGLPLYETKNILNSIGVK
tara:strand:+ start:2373 stop:2939 length:567 start_codon:yes stop_codon:yes gene_type:complete